MIEIKNLFDMENDDRAKDCINQSKKFYSRFSKLIDEDVKQNK